jgi:hypothetical protein
MVRDLQQVDRRQATGEELGVDALLDVPREQEPATGDLAEEHDRDVVDAGPGVAWPLGDAVGVRPEDAESDRVERQSITGREAAARRPAVGEDLCPRVVARTGPEHPGLVDPAHPVPMEQQGQPGDVVLVRMAEHEDVDPPVPWRQPLVERDEQPTRIRAAVDDHPSAATTFNEDPVALPDVEDDDARHAIRAVRDDEAEPDDRSAERDGGDSESPVRARPAGGRP